MKGLPSLPKLGALIALISIGALMVWLQEINLPTAHTLLPAEHGEPDYYIEVAQLTRFNVQGQRIQRLDSEQVTHYPEQDISLFEKPLMHHYSPQGQVWRVLAERAEHRGENEIYLEDNVVITPINPNSAYIPEFLTDRLWIDSLANLASTPDPVSFISPGGITTGKGFSIELNTGLAEILQEVKGNYLSTPAQQDTKQ